MSKKYDYKIGYETLQEEWEIHLKRISKSSFAVIMTKAATRNMEVGKALDAIVSDCHNQQPDEPLSFSTIEYLQKIDARIIWIENLLSNANIAIVKKE